MHHSLIDLRIHIRALAVAAIAITSLGRDALSDPQSERAEGDRARTADLDFLVARIFETHPEPLRRHTREQWDREIARVRASAGELTDARFFVELSSLVALLGDGHSTLLPAPNGLGAFTYPLDLEFFDDGLFVLAADPAYAAAVGKKIVAIGGHPIDAVLELAAPSIPADNPQGAKVILELALAMPCFHDAWGLSSGTKSRITVAGADGKREEVELALPEPGPPPFFGPRPSTWVGAEPRELPLYLRHPEKKYFVEYLEPERCVYIRFREVQHDEPENFNAFCKRAFAMVDERNAERLVIDLRGNRGGNNYITQPLIHGVIKSRLNEPGRVFVLIDGKTFSAAQNCASYLERETWALFVGAPTAGSPNHCGDAESFALPKSGHVLYCSTVRWQDSDPRDARRWTYPDLPVETHFADFAAGRDLVLDAALHHESSAIEGYTGVLPRAHWQRATQSGSWPIAR